MICTHDKVIDLWLRMWIGNYVWENGTQNYTLGRIACLIVYFQDAERLRDSVYARQIYISIPFFWQHFNLKRLTIRALHNSCQRERTLLPDVSFHLEFLNGATATSLMYLCVIISTFTLLRSITCVCVAVTFWKIKRHSPVQFFF